MHIKLYQYVYICIWNMLGTTCWSARVYPHIITHPMATSLGPNAAHRSCVSCATSLSASPDDLAGSNA